MLLYDSRLSGNCYKVRLLMARLGIACERVELSVVDRSNREEVLGGLNPALRVPTLELDDGRHLAESNAILWYLAEGTDLVPDDPFERAQVLQWMFFEQYDHEPNIGVARYWTTILGRAAQHAGDLGAKHEGGHRALAAMEDHLAARAWLVGESFTIADVCLYAYTHMADEGGFDLEGYPAVRAWLERVASQPGHVAIDA